MGIGQISSFKRVRYKRSSGIEELPACRGEPIGISHRTLISSYRIIKAVFEPMR